MPDLPYRTLPDLDRAPVTEALRRELYDAVVRLAFPEVPDPEEIAPTFIPSDPKKALEGATIPVHPGALRYYKEIGVVS